jgi:hypothetical protein
MEVLFQLFLNSALHRAERCISGSSHFVSGEKAHINKSRRAYLVSELIVDTMVKIKYFTVASN